MNGISPFQTAQPPAANQQIGDMLNTIMPLMMMGLVFALIMPMFKGMMGKE